MTAQPNGEPIRVGDLVVQPLFDGVARLQADMWAGADWTAHQHLFGDDAATMTVPVGGFLVRVGDRLVLLDAGGGNLHDDMFDCGAMLDSMRAVGVMPNDIDDVIVSHLHSDHIGWLEADGAAVFSRATIHIGAADWKHFVDNASSGQRRADRLNSIASHVQLIDSDESTPLPGVTLRATPGHTPGHMSTVLSSGTERLIVMGDAVHCPAQLTETEWEFVSDVDPKLAVRTRSLLLQEAEQPGTTMLPCHFPGMRAARLMTASGDRRWVLGS
jgi:glyoxylase-like metal-dependent hydrolase (beta-lactamase superfamily II)